VKKQQHHQVANRLRSPAGLRCLGTATRISASLFRRLSAFFLSTPGQDPKAAKFAVLNPGHAEFSKRVERSEGSDTTPTQNTPCFGVRAAVCDFSPKAEWCYPLSLVKANVAVCAGGVENRMTDALEMLV